MKARRISILRLLGIGLVIVSLALILFSVWILNLDRQGDFYNTAAIADLDGDGDPDVVLHNRRNESEFTAFSVTTLWINQGGGRFEPQRLEAEAGWAATAGDLDVDGDTDLVVYRGSSVRFLLNQDGIQSGEAGAFASAFTLRPPETLDQYGSLLLGDLDADGLPDGVVLGCCGRAFTLSPDDDTPNFSWVWISEQPTSGRLVPRAAPLEPLDGLTLRAGALSDMDGDGDLDLFGAVSAPAEGRNRDPSDRVLLNDGGGVFTDSGQRLGEADSICVALGDLDGDGDPDALVGGQDGARVWLNQGGAQGGQAGTFREGGGTLGDGLIRGVFLADLDADGDLDAFIAGPERASVWWNEGSGAFVPGGQRFWFSERHGLAVADLDGDDLPDLFAAEYDQAYAFWINEGDGTFSRAC